MKKRNVKQHMNGLAALLLFGLFAFCVLAVLLTGAGAYRRLTARDQAAYEWRSCTQYIATRVRWADCSGGVAVEQFGGVPALRLTDEAGYVTRVYCCGGYLMELYASADTELAPEDGEKLLEADGLLLSEENGLLQITLLGGGAEDTLYLFLRSREGAA